MYHLVFEGKKIKYWVVFNPVFLECRELLIKHLTQLFLIYLFVCISLGNGLFAIRLTHN